MEVPTEDGEYFSVLCADTATQTTKDFPAIPPFPSIKKQQSPAKADVTAAADDGRSEADMNAAVIGTEGGVNDSACTTHHSSGGGCSSTGGGDGGSCDGQDMHRDEEEAKDEPVLEETVDGMVGSDSETLAEDDIVMLRLPSTDSEEELVRLVQARIMKADVEQFRECMARKVAIWSYWSSSGRHRTRKQDKKLTAEGGELRRMMLDKWPEVAWEAELA